MKGIIFLAWALVFTSAAAWSQKVTATVDKKKILIGEQFHLKLQANFSDRETPDFFELDTIPHFEILDRSVIDTSKFNDGFALRQELTLTSWDSGRIRIAPFVLGRNKTEGLVIDVAYSPSPFDTTQPYHDIHEILPEKKPVPTTWYWYLIGLLVLLVLFLLFFPRAKPPAPGEFVSDETAFKKALKKLLALEKKGPADSKVFYTELVQVFREYVHKRINIYSFSKTTEDIALQIKDLNIDREEYDRLVQTLVLSDAVKFAKYQPSEGEKEESIHAVRQGVMSIENHYASQVKTHPKL